MDKLARIRENRRATRDTTGDDVGYEQLILEQREKIESRDATIKEALENKAEAQEEG